jgi:hypothetical protein
MAHRQAILRPIRREDVLPDRAYLLESCDLFRCTTERQPGIQLASTREHVGHVESPLAVEGDLPPPVAEGFIVGQVVS